MTKRAFQILIVLGVLIASLAPAGAASAWSNCPNYLTVQWGDTLSGIAQRCGTTMSAIQAANPGLGWWVYAGQVLYIPGGSSYDPGYYPPAGSTYVVQPGDTLKKIADRSGVSWRDILAVNPQIYNPSLIYVGQVINLPVGVVVPPPVYPPPPTAPCNCPNDPSSPIDAYSTLKIDYVHGLFVRALPNGRIIASGRDKSEWLYDPASLQTDSKGKVWVKVHLYPAVNGYTSGWMLVRDQLGKYFTKPPLP